MLRPTMWMLALALGACGPEDTITPDLGPAPDVQGHAPTMRRLSQTQYENAVRDLVAPGLYVPADIEPELRLDGLAAIGASEVAISPRGVERFESAAYLVAEQAMDPEHRDAVVPCTPAAVDDEACARETLATFGRRAWRRPLTDEELDALVGVSVAAAQALDDFHDGIEFGIAAVLQAPDFLMIPEVGQPDAKDGGRVLTGFEVATRLSFLLWNSIPDDALLDAAERGELDTLDGIDSAAIRMLEDPRSRDGVRAWVTDMLHLDALDDLQKDPGVFVYLNDAFADAAREETLHLYERLVFDVDGDLRNLLDTRTTWLDRSLAMLYDVRAPAREGFGEVELPADGPRAGLLGHASMLALHAHPTSTSATLRGKFLRETLLCTTLPPPPADVDTSIPQATPDKPTRRALVEAHLENPACRGCHEQMDPIGLGLEHFDGLGVYRDLENGAPIDASGELDGDTFDDALGLAKAVRKHELFVPCLVEQMTRYALGRSIDEGDDAEASLTWLTDRFALRDHRLQPLILDLVTSPLYRRVGETE